MYICIYTYKLPPMAVKLCHWFHKHQQCWKHLGRISLMKLIEPGHSGKKMLFDLMKSWLFLVGILSLVFPMKQASRIHYCILYISKPINNQGFFTDTVGNLKSHSSCIYNHPTPILAVNPELDSAKNTKIAI